MTLFQYFKKVDRTIHDQPTWSTRSVLKRSTLEEAPVPLQYEAPVPLSLIIVELAAYWAARSRKNTSTEPY